MKRGVEGEERCITASYGQYCLVSYLIDCTAVFEARSDPVLKTFFNVICRHLPPFRLYFTTWQTEHENEIQGAWAATKCRGQAQFQWDNVPCPQNRKLPHVTPRQG